MSYGSISHMKLMKTWHVAMNRIGGKSNSGEGGENKLNVLKKLPNGDSKE